LAVAVASIGFGVAIAKGKFNFTNNYGRMVSGLILLGFQSYSLYLLSKSEMIIKDRNDHLKELKEKWDKYDKNNNSNSQLNSYFRPTFTEIRNRLKIIEKSDFFKKAFSWIYQNSIANPIQKLTSTICLNKDKEIELDCSCQNDDSCFDFNPEFDEEFLQATDESGIIKNLYYINSILRGEMSSSELDREQLEDSVKKVYSKFRDFRINSFEIISQFEGFDEFENKVDSELQSIQKNTIDYVLNSKTFKSLSEQNYLPGGNREITRNLIKLTPPKRLEKYHRAHFGVSKKMGTISNLYQRPEIETSQGDDAQNGQFLPKLSIKIQTYGNKHMNLFKILHYRYMKKRILWPTTNKN